MNQAQTIQTIQTGDPSDPIRSKVIERIEQRFWAKVDKSGECWLWKASVASARGGYGLFNLDGHCEQAHRRAYILTYGEVPAGMVVRHSCDNPPCVRPEHLKIGTYKENSRDAIERNPMYGRALRRPKYGSLNPAAKLTEDAALHILSVKGIQPAEEISQQYGITTTAVRNIWKGKAWKHLSIRR